MLSGSEYKCANPNKCRAANLRGLAIAIVVRAEEQKVSKVRRRIWFTLWENERKEAQEYQFRKWERNYRRDPRSYGEPNKKYCTPEGAGTRNWLRKSLFGEGVDWYRLHKLIFTELKRSSNHNCKWWRDVKDICEDTTGFDPVDKILKLSNEYAEATQKPTGTWKPPKRYIGSKEIVSDYQVPRTTLQYWVEKDSPKVVKDPQTQECHYPKKWFEERAKNYKP